MRFENGFLTLPKRGCPRLGQALYAAHTARLVFVVAFLALAGCRTGGTIHATGNEEQAKQAVQLVLEAWKSGAKLTEFSTSHPELVVADEDWQSGGVLTSFKLIEPAVLNGSHWRQKTELQLKGKGKSKSAVAIYDVTLGEKTVILRSDFQY